MTGHTDGGKAMNDLTLLLFRVNNLILTWGDRLVAPYGLTSARWQVMGAIAASVQPQSVAWLARDLGGNRQNIQRIANDLEKAGLVVFLPNPHHKRAQLVDLTASGRKVFDEATRLYRPQADAMARGLAPEDLSAAQRVLSAMRDWLEAEAENRM